MATLPTDGSQFAFKYDYDASGNVTYMGRAVIKSLTSDPVWEIRKFTYDGSGNLTGITWAGGNKSNTNIWDNRASLSYS